MSAKLQKSLALVGYLGLYGREYQFSREEQEDIRKKAMKGKRKRKRKRTNGQGARSQSHARKRLGCPAWKMADVTLPDRDDGAVSIRQPRLGTGPDLVAVNQSVQRGRARSLSWPRQLVLFLPSRLGE